MCAFSCPGDEKNSITKQKSSLHVSLDHSTARWLMYMWICSMNFLVFTVELFHIKLVINNNTASISWEKLVSKTRMKSSSKHLRLVSSEYQRTKKKGQFTSENWHWIFKWTHIHTTAFDQQKGSKENSGCPISQLFIIIIKLLQQQVLQGHNPHLVSVCLYPYLSLRVHDFNLCSTNITRITCPSNEPFLHSLHES